MSSPQHENTCLSLQISFNKVHKVRAKIPPFALKLPKLHINPLEFDFSSLDPKLGILFRFGCSFSTQLIIKS